MKTIETGMIISIISIIYNQSIVRYVFLLTLLLALVTGAKNSYAGYASIVVDKDTGEVLHEKNADIKNYPASLTKMMTLYLLFEALSDAQITLSQKLPVSRQASRMPPTKLYLKKGQRIRVADAILALVTKSANDAAVVIAEALGGTEQKFAVMMTKKARKLGMHSTTFYNASGLPHKKQLSTARDMAILSMSLLRDFPEYYDYFSTRKFRFQGRTYKNHNKLLFSYKGTDGIKTGYTRASRYNLAASAVRNNRRLVAVALGCRTSHSRNRHVAQLLDKGFSQIAQPNFVKTSPSYDSLITNSYNKRYKKNKFSPPRVISTKQSNKKDSMAHQKGWSIQIGTFSKYSRAYQSAASARRSEHDILANCEIIVEVVVYKRRTLYKARLVGLNKPDAMTACERLLNKTGKCFIIPSQ